MDREAYIDANYWVREAKEHRDSIADAVRHAEVAQIKVEMAVNSSAVLISATRGYLDILKISLAEAIEAEAEAVKNANRSYERRCAEQGITAYPRSTQSHVQRRGSRSDR